MHNYVIVILRLPETGDVSSDNAEIDVLANVKKLTTEQCISIIAQQATRFESGIHEVEKHIKGILNVNNISK